MIPLQIKLRNFLSYGAYTQTVDFEPYRLICLSGKNGHGKSALLDAMTWALWGQARKTSATSKADEGLMRLGQTHMMVTFDFICSEKKYRVQREFVLSGNKAAHTELHFGIVERDGSCSSLTEKTARATQQKIIETIGLDYDSCINSVFLRQGQSNEFSNKSAKERKEILATILGINRYEALRTQAVEKSREHAVMEEQLTPIVDHLKRSALQKPELLAQLHQLEQTSRELQQQHNNLQQKEQEYLLLQRQLAEQHQKKMLLEQQRATFGEQFEKKRTALHSARPQLHALRAALRATEKIISAQEQQKLWAEHELLETTRTAVAQLKEELLHAQLQQKELVNRLTAEYHAKLAQHTAQMQKDEIALVTITQRHQEFETTDREKKRILAAIETSIVALGPDIAMLTATLATKDKKFERTKQCYHTFIARGNSIAQELQELEHKQLLGDTPSSVACPLCEQALSSSRKKFLQEKFTQRHSLLTHQKERLMRIVPHLKTFLVDEHARLQLLREQLLTLKDLTEKKKIIIAETAQAQQQLTVLAKTKLEAQQTLEKARHAQQACEREREQFFMQHENYATIVRTIADLQKKSTEIIYNEERHLQIKKMIALINQHEVDGKQHAQQQVAYEQCKLQLQTLIQEMRTIKKELQELAKNLHNFVTLPQQQEKLATEITAVAEQLKNNGLQTAELLQKKGRIDQQLAMITEQEKELANYLEQQQKHTVEKDDYQTIAQALGKNGIQALLIETALPELEHEANTILSKLTDNQSHIIIESVRDLKSGGYKETLDIKISDAVGTRPYELFSGGEAFRIDFALRIALSKLLARRSGTSLQTLIIDEGFGSQDEEGLARIMEALYKIQDDFAKIIIVSHLPEMKNQFPTHFFVHKNASGSQISVFEQG